MLFFVFLLFPPFLIFFKMSNRKPKKKSRQSGSPSVRSGRSPTRKEQVTVSHPLRSIDTKEKLRNLIQESDDWCVSNSDSELNGITANINTLQTLKIPQGSLVIIYPSIIMNETSNTKEENKFPTLIVPIFISKNCIKSSKNTNTSKKIKINILFIKIFN